MFELFWMVFWEQKTELVCSLSITEDTEFIFNLIEDDVWEVEYEKKVPLLIDLIVGIGQVLKYDQCICPLWMMDKNKIKMRFNDFSKTKKVWRKISWCMFIICLDKSPIYLMILTYISK